MKEVSVNKDIKLSPHFTLGEMTKTSYHPQDGNIPSRVHIENLINLCENWQPPLRGFLKKKRRTIRFASLVFYADGLGFLGLFLFFL